MSTPIRWPVLTEHPLSQSAWVRRRQWLGFALLLSPVFAAWIMDFGIIDLELPHFNSVRSTVVGQQPSGPVFRVGECIWATQVIMD